MDQKKQLGKKVATYSLDQETLDRIKYIQKLRKEQGRRFDGYLASKSAVVHDAILLLYNFEVFGIDIMHKGRVNRKDNHAKPQEKYHQLK